MLEKAQTALRLATDLAAAAGGTLYAAGTTGDALSADTWPDMVRELGMAGIVLIFLSGAFWLARRLVQFAERHGDTMVQAWTRKAERDAEAASQHAANGAKMVEIVDGLGNTLRDHGQLLHRLVEMLARIEPAVERIDKHQD